MTISYEKNIKEINGVIHKQCKDCLEWIPLNEETFNKHNKSKDGFFPYCKACYQKRVYKWQSENRDKMKSYFRKADSTDERKKSKREMSKQRAENGKYKVWIENNREKLAQYRTSRIHKHHDITDDEWIFCKEFFSNSCAYCGLSLEEQIEIYRQDFSKDHFENEGSNGIENCLPACKQCNSKKWKFSFNDWYNKENPVFSKERLEKIIFWIKETNS